jgi:hypothetical protein
MRELMLSLVGMAMISAAALLMARADAAVPTASVATIAGETSAVEQAATCLRRRVCGPRGCAWRTVCRRWR